MSRAGQATESKDYPLAIELLDRVIALEPKWAEAWYRRANAFYLSDDPVGAMADIRRVLDLEPHHFGAWAGLGTSSWRPRTRRTPSKPIVRP